MYGIEEWTTEAVQIDSIEIRFDYLKITRIAGFQASEELWKTYLQVGTAV